MSTMPTLAGVELDSFEYHRESETYRARYDQDTTSASMAVVATVSKAVGCSPIDLEPLYDFVDPDALDNFVRVRDTMEGDISVTFTAMGREISVYSSGVIAVDSLGRDQIDEKTGRDSHR